MRLALGFTTMMAMIGAPSGPVLADGLLGQIKKGASEIGSAIGEGVHDAGEAIGSGTQAAGDGAQKVGTAISDELDATTDLFATDATPDEMRAQLDQTAEAALTKLVAEQPEAQPLLDAAAGYAVFDVRRVTVLGASGGGGRGVAVNTATDARTYMNAATAGVGLGVGFGGFSSKLVILFETPDAFNRFVTEGLDATAQGGAHAGESGTEQLARFQDGRAVFVLTKKGWRVTATLTGTKYWPDAELNATN